MQRILPILLLAITILPSATASNATSLFMIELSDPDVQITVPGIPEFEMSAHPLSEQNPIFKLRGGNDEVSISVIIPEIDDTVSPMSCATSVAKSILDLGQVVREQLFLGRANDQTFLIIYGLPLEKAVLLNTHIVSADTTGHCVEAHVSMISRSDSDIEPWFNGFGEANIASY